MKELQPRPVVVLVVVFVVVFVVVATGWHKQHCIIKIPDGTFFCCCCCFFCGMSISQGSSCVLMYVMALSIAVDTSHDNVIRSKTYASIQN